MYQTIAILALFTLIYSSIQNGVGPQQLIYIFKINLVLNAHFGGQN
jgi:hypothetical protein